MIGKIGNGFDISIAQNKRKKNNEKDIELNGMITWAIFQVEKLIPSYAHPLKISNSFLVPTDEIYTFFHLYTLN